MPACPISTGLSRPMGSFGGAPSFFLLPCDLGTGLRSSGWARIAGRLPKTLHRPCSIFSMNEGTSGHGRATQPSSRELQATATLPATMRAVVYHGVNDMRVETVPVPAIGPGELLVRIATCGICG